MIGHRLFVLWNLSYLHAVIFEIPKQYFIIKPPACWGADVSIEIYELLLLFSIITPWWNPSITFLKEQFVKFHGIEFVDEDSEKDIDLPIGSDLYWSFAMGNIVKSGESGGLVAVESKLGWILSSCVDVGGKMQSVDFVSSATSEVRIGGENDEIENQLKWF